MKNKFKILFFLGIFVCMSARIGYICYTIPDNIYVTEKEKYSFDKYGFFSPLFSMDVAVGESGELNCDGQVRSKSTYSANVRFLNVFTVKNVDVNLLDSSYLVPGGDVVGIKIYAGGVQIIKISEFEDEGGRMCSPCKNVSFKKGDVIREVNGKKTETTGAFVKEMQKNGGNKAVLRVERENEEFCVDIFPQKDAKGAYKAGLVVKDSMAGIGTLTYYNPSDRTFGALGHAIEDADTEKIFPLGKGSVEDARVVSIEKGRRGMPGQLHGMFAGDLEWGEITKNSPLGIFGSLKKEKPAGDALPIGKVADIKEGGAYIICTVDESGPKNFSIEIERIIFANANNSKGMVIRVTDTALLNATGGIVQGMSGSPIIQNGKIIGAVTHVFVNDPTRGYGIFIENMLAESEKNK